MGSVMAMRTAVATLILNPGCMRWESMSSFVMMGTCA